MHFCRTELKKIFISNVLLEALILQQLYQSNFMYLKMQTVNNIKAFHKGFFTKKQDSLKSR